MKRIAVIVGIAAAMGVFAPVAADLRVSRMGRRSARGRYR